MERVMNGSALDNRRVAAALIDLAIVAVGGAAILALAGVLGKGPSEIGLPLAAVIVAWALYYYFACESGAGQTVGKRLMRLRVVRTDGGAAGMREVGIRTVLRLIDMQFACLVGLLVMMATGERRGRLGDLAADTMVVSVEDEPVAPAPTVTVTPVEEEEPDIASPALRELAVDVEAAKEARPEEPEPVSVDEPEPEPVVEIKPIETVSAMDLVMADDEPESEPIERDREDASQPR
jgi:uncharacterized RDD family membrane protein YckC